MKFSSALFIFFRLDCAELDGGFDKTGLDLTNVQLSSVLFFLQQNWVQTHSGATCDNRLVYRLLQQCSILKRAIRCNHGAGVSLWSGQMQYLYHVVWYRWVSVESVQCSPSSSCPVMRVSCCVKKAVNQTKVLLQPAKAVHAATRECQKNPNKTAAWASFSTNMFRCLP